MPKSTRWILLYLGTLVMLGLFSFGQIGAIAQESKPEFNPSAYNLELKWESVPDFNIPEAVFYDADRDLIYVANINGGLTAKDGNGFISTMNLDGEIISLEWATGLNAPKGMNLKDGILYVADIDEVVLIDTSTGDVVDRLSAAGGMLLNDIAVDELGTLYVSDTLSEKIYQIRDSVVSVLVEDPILGGVNGIIHDAGTGNLLAGINRRGILISIDLESLEIETLVQGFGAFDGIVPDGNGNYWVSDFNARIFLTDLNQRHQYFLPLRNDSADIDYVIDQKLLLIPTFRGNQVVAFDVTMTE